MRCTIQCCKDFIPTCVILVQSCAELRLPVCDILYNNIRWQRTTTQKKMNKNALRATSTMSSVPYHTAPYRGIPYRTVVYRIVPDIDVAYCIPGALSRETWGKHVTIYLHKSRVSFVFPMNYYYYRILNINTTIPSSQRFISHSSKTHHAVPISLRRINYIVTILIPHWYLIRCFGVYLVL